MTKNTKQGTRPEGSRNKGPNKIADFSAYFAGAPGGDVVENLVSQSRSQLERFSQDFSSFGREGFDAYNKTAAIFAKGFEEFFRTGAEIAQEAAEKQANLLKTAMSSKSVNEWAEAGNRLTQTALDDSMAAATRLSEIGARLLTESAQPLSDQLTRSMKKASESLAA